MRLRSAQLEGSLGSEEGPGAGTSPGSDEGSQLAVGTSEGSEEAGSQCWDVWWVHSGTNCSTGVDAEGTGGEQSRPVPRGGAGRVIYGARSPAQDRGTEAGGQS